MAIRAKFTCVSVEDFGDNKTAKLRAVYGSAEENKDFTKYTPSGEISINITKDAPADGALVPGMNYYVDFTPVEDNV